MIVRRHWGNSYHLFGTYKKDFQGDPRGQTRNGALAFSNESSF